MSVIKYLFLMIIGFLAAYGLLVLLGRMTPNSDALMIGVFCGVAASVPTSIFLLFALTRGRIDSDNEDYGDISVIKDNEYLQIGDGNDEEN